MAHINLTGQGFNLRIQIQGRWVLQEENQHNQPERQVVQNPDRQMPLPEQQEPRVAEQQEPVVPRAGQQEPVVPRAGRREPVVLRAGRQAPVVEVNRQIAVAEQQEPLLAAARNCQNPRCTLSPDLHPEHDVLE